MKGAEVYESPSATYALGAEPATRDDTKAVAAHATTMTTAAARDRMMLPRGRPTKAMVSGPMVECRP
jgi:hypothetical protein